jgi:hypothetical protein
MSYRKRTRSEYALRRTSKIPAKRGLKKRRAPSEPKALKSEVYTPYYSKEFRDVVRYIQTELDKKVYLIGIRAMFHRGIPLWRFTDDFDVYTPLVQEEREKIIDFVRGKYEGAKHVWSKFGFGLDFDPIGHIDVTIIPPATQDESWDKDTIETNGVQVYLPPLEDIIVLKLLSPRRKDAKDVGVALRLGKEKINFEGLKVKAENAGVSKKLNKIAKRYGEDLNFPVA